MQPQDCLQVGREIVFVIMELAPLVPDYDAIWKKLSGNTPDAGSDTKLISWKQLVTTPTPRHVTVARVTYEMERELMFVFQRVKMGQQKRYQMWFAERFLHGSDCDTLIPSLVRFICCNWHPPNQVLCSEIVTRWAILGWLLKSVHSDAALTAAEFALFYDWFWFDPKTDNIMNIEPAILLMVCSVDQYPGITAMLMSYLVRAPYSFPENMRETVLWGIHNSFMTVLQKRVIHSLDSLLSFSHVDPKTRTRFQELVSGPRKQANDPPESKTSVSTISQPQQQPQQHQKPVVLPQILSPGKRLDAKVEEKQESAKPAHGDKASTSGAQGIHSSSSAATPVAPAAAATSSAGSKCNPDEVPVETAVSQYSAKPCCKTLAQLLLSLGDGEKGISDVVSAIQSVVSVDVTDFRTNIVTFSYGSLQALFHLYKASSKHRKVSIKIIASLAKSIAPVRYRLLTFLLSTTPGGLTLGKALKGFIFPGKNMKWCKSTKDSMKIANRNITLTNEDAQLLFENIIHEQPAEGFSAARHFQPYFDLLKELGVGPEKDCFITDCKLCCEQCPVVFSYVYPLLLRWLPNLTVGCSDLAASAIRVLSPQQFCLMVAVLGANELTMIGDQVDYSEFMDRTGSNLHYHEQLWLWDLFVSEIRSSIGDSTNLGKILTRIEALVDSVFSVTSEPTTRTSAAAVIGIRQLLTCGMMPTSRVIQNVICPGHLSIVPTSVFIIRHWCSSSWASSVITPALVKLPKKTLSTAQQSGLLAVTRSLHAHGSSSVQQIMQQSSVKHAIDTLLPSGDQQPGSVGGGAGGGPPLSPTSHGVVRQPTTGIVSLPGAGITRKRSRFVIDDSDEDD